MAAASFPDVHVTGPVQHYVRVPTSDNLIYFLGTAEVTPQMQRRRYYQNVMNDLAGKTLPFQKTYDGEAATVSVALTRYSKEAWAAILDAGHTRALTSGNGRETRWSRGAPVYGQLTIELWQVYDNVFNPAGASAGLEIGWYWPQVTLVQHDTIAAGTQAEKLLLVFDCTPEWNFDGDRGWVLYENNPAYFPNDVRVPQ